MICDKCKKHIDRQFLCRGKAVNCLAYGCDGQPGISGTRPCSRNDICDYIYDLIYKNEDMLK